MRRLQRPSLNCLFIVTLVSMFAAATVDASRTETFRVHPPADGPREGKSQRTYFVATTASEDDMQAFRERLIEAGCRAVNWFLPENVIVCELPKTKDISGVLATAPALRRMEANALGPQFASGAPLSYIERAYEMADRLPSVTMTDIAGDQRAVEEMCAVKVNSPEKVRQIERELEEFRARQQAMGIDRSTESTSRAVNQNSEFLGSSIIGHFFYPENTVIGGDPQANTWTQTDITDVVSATTAFMLDYQGQFTGMNIHVTMSHHRKAPTKYEPIKHNSNTDPVWILDVIHRADSRVASITDDQGAVHEFNNLNRRGHAWVFTSFIANSRSEPTNRFLNAGYTAYAFLGGPYNVNPFPAGGDPKGIGYQLVASKIYQHETGHTFWTLDEYPGAPGVCAATSGYLAWENGNITMTGPGGQARCEPLVDCIMHSAARDPVGRPFCDWSQGQLGVIDFNGNAVPDIYEGEPFVEFSIAGPETVQTRDYHLSFKAVSRAISNLNPFQDPEHRVDYAVGLKSGAVAIGGTTLPINLTTLDGDWDEQEEDVEFRLQLNVGVNRLNVQIRSDVGYKSRWYRKDVYYAGVNYSQLSAHAKTNRIDVTWRIFGEDFNAVYNLYRQKIGSDDDYEPVAQGVLPSGPDLSGFIPYRFIDREVQPGDDYKYHVEGVFTLNVDGEDIEYHINSTAVATTAMIPITSGTILSYGSPNPFNNQVTISLSIPPTYEQSEVATGSGGSTSFEKRVATVVDVAVFDVRGRRIKSLRTTGEFVEVLTLRWDGTDQFNRAVPAGVYFVKAIAGDVTGVTKVVLVR